MKKVLTASLERPKTKRDGRALSTRVRLNRLNNGGVYETNVIRVGFVRVFIFYRFVVKERGGGGR